MAKFKVLVIGHQLKNKIVAGFGDVIDESQLMGKSEDLVKAGFIEEIQEAVGEDEISLDEMTKSELISFAKLNDFKITESAKKDFILNEIDDQIKIQEAVGDVIVTDAENVK